MLIEAALFFLCTSTFDPSEWWAGTDSEPQESTSDAATASSSSSSSESPAAEVPTSSAGANSSSEKKLGDAEPRGGLRLSQTESATNASADAGSVPPTVCQMFW